MRKFRTGFGIDVHRFIENRKLIIGGVEIPFEKGLEGHSDADVLIHAICDSILGALALGDIGKHFPDTDEKFRNVSSVTFLYEVKRLIDEKGFLIGNIDTMLALQKPKVAAYIPEMQKVISEALGIDEDQISIKATTTEKLGYVGREEGVTAYANALLEKNEL